ncbi:hypothetical protein PLUTE_b0732 [Pseudoalteromonas luteoviolacea DSM 6061]|nr:hypothetical protein [Pseudoalteromonas luteoviolacea DSM 6061]
MYDNKNENRYQLQNLKRFTLDIILNKAMFYVTFDASGWSVLVEF